MTTGRVLSAGGKDDSSKLARLHFHFSFKLVNLVFRSISNHQFGEEWILVKGGGKCLQHKSYESGKEVLLLMLINYISILILITET